MGASHSFGDYVRKELYLEAVNERIKKWNGKDVENYLMSPEDLFDSNRPEVVKRWCQDPKNNLKIPDKVSITYYLIDLATGERQEKLIDDSLQNQLCKLYESIIAAFFK